MQSHVLTNPHHHHHHHYSEGFPHLRGGTFRSRSRVVQQQSMAAHQWYPPPRPAFDFAAAAPSTSSSTLLLPPSNSREMRNRAEKQRRDRLNAFIGELATLVPLVSKSTKRLDKTSILRLTAVHLRLYQTLAQGRGVAQMELPKYVDQFVLDQLVCDQLGGFLLILCPNGKIIFVSHTVESLLGHLQTDLMGQSLFGLAAPEDHEKLRTHLQSEGEVDTDWRKYFAVSLRRAGPRSETPVYESVRMMGVHRHLGGSAHAPDSPSTSSSSSSVASPQATPVNTDILVFFVKICRPEPLVDRLVVASKDEYVTRHLIDGRIINCDQRISLIAGYMIEEVHGRSAFLYMHRDDVRWVMIALRQMYDRGESKGNSCYRLKSRNGQFIYLRTFGFLEIDDRGIVESFVCVNSLVDEGEGLRQIQEMKQRYSALVSQAASDVDGENGHATIEEWTPPTKRPAPEPIDDFVEDPRKIEEAISQLMRDLPSPGSEEEAESPPRTPEAAVVPPTKPEPVAKTLPKPHHPHLRLKTGGKRAPSSPEASRARCKRSRMDSTDSECSQLSPPPPPQRSAAPVKAYPINNSSSQPELADSNHRTV
ncbi:basic helix-loop-helix ARNT-like protein 1 isoform X2 [Cylas formicarius]|uniref:basic helix-loop-helix ARNT-like protein 1 isoform X2 n=1 Tax=Cylas formicarius TaxID=197179 RepID=UPI002958B18C|nr:basic helix-loop-helix ARNT-like protein 1 isoform X2 [Cylas formicarius]